MHGSWQGIIGGVALLAACLTTATARAFPPAYVVEETGAGIEQFDTAFGGLTPLSPARVDLPAGFLAGVTVSPDGRSAYVVGYEERDEGQGSLIYQYDITPGGTLSPKLPASVVVTEGATQVTLTPDGRFAYVAWDGGGVTGYAVAADGTLSRLPGEDQFIGSGSVTSAITPDGRTLVVGSTVFDVIVSRSRGDVLQLGIGADGSLTAPRRASWRYEPVADVVVGADGRTAYVAYGRLGITLLRFGDDGVVRHVADSPEFSPVRTLALSPDGNHLYGASASGEVGVFTVGPTGALTYLRSYDLDPGGGLIDVAVSPDGRSLYAIDQGDDEVEQYAVSADGATLTPLTPAKVATGDRPLEIAVAPDPAVAVPAAGIIRPADGSTLDVGDVVVADYECYPGYGGPAISACTSDKGPAGTPIDTSTPGSFSMTATATSSNGRVVSRTVGYSVEQINDAPVAKDQAVTTDEDVPVAIALDASDPDGEPLQIAVIAQPLRGSVACAATACTYRSHRDFHGEDRFVYRAADPHGVGDDAVVTVTVRPVADAPRPQDATRTIAEDASTTFTMSATDPEGGTVTYAAQQPANGAVSCNGTSCTYAPNANFNGEDTVTYTATDPEGNVGTGKVVVTITPVNDPPTARDQHMVIDENTSLTFGLDVSDPDDPFSLDAVITDFPDHGGASCSGQVCDYVPGSNFAGEDAFTYEVSDGFGAVARATVSFTVRAVNDPPDAEDQSLSTDEDTNLRLELRATDPDGGELIFSHRQPSHGGVACDDDGCTYDPNTNYHGPDAFEFTVTDDHGESDTGRIDITVRAVNDPPAAIGQSLSTDEDTEITFGLDVADVDGDALSATVSADPTRGSATCAGTTCTYEPDQDVHGEDGFAYVVSDGRGGTATATVFVTMRPVNDAPLAEDSAVSVFEDAGVTFTLGAADADGDALTYTPERPAHGSLECTGNGCLYEPDDDYHGDDAFSFTVSDGQGGSDSGSVDITVQSINDAPVAQDRRATVAEDSSVTFAIAAADVDEDSLSAAVSGGPSHGTAACEALSCTYEPAANHNGGDSFVVTVSDGHGGFDTATVSVTVTPVNDAPTAQNVTVATDEDTAVQLALLGADVDGDALTYTVTGAGPQNGTATCSGALCTYTPAENYHGPDAFTYRVADPSGASADASVSITVNSVVDATALTVPPAIRVLSQPLLRLTIPFEARLTRSPGGQPLAGRTITFVADGQPRCSALTDAQGVAKCAATPPSLLSALVGLGYTAVFDGDSVYAGSSAKGALVA